MHQKSTQFLLRGTIDFEMSTMQFNVEETAAASSRLTMQTAHAVDIDASPESEEYFESQSDAEIVTEEHVPLNVTYQNDFYAVETIVLEKYLILKRSCHTFERIFDVELY